MSDFEVTQRQTVEKLARRLLAIAPRPASFAAVLTAVGLIVLGGLLKLPIDLVAGAPLPPYITIYPLLPLIGFLSGFRVGAASVIFSMLFAWYVYVPPAFSLGIPERRTLATLIVFMLAGSFTVLVGAFARDTLQRFLANEQDEQRNAREAVHRTKNLITVIRSLGRMDLRRTRDLEEFWELLDGKLSALARTQDLLVGVREGEASLTEIVEASIEPCLENARLAYRPGPHAPAPPKEFASLALALHELCTNSLKYGAMGLETGQIELSWTVTDGVCELFWLEQCDAIGDGGDSFGSLLIRTALNRVQGSQVDYQRAPGAVTCRFRWPLNGR